MKKQHQNTENRAKKSAQARVGVLYGLDLGTKLGLVALSVVAVALLMVGYRVIQANASDEGVFLAETLDITADLPQTTFSEDATFELTVDTPFEINAFALAAEGQNLQSEEIEEHAAETAEILATGNIDEPAEGHEIDHAHEDEDHSHGDTESIGSASAEDEPVIEGHSHSDTSSISVSYYNGNFWQPVTPEDDLNSPTEWGSPYWEVGELQDIQLRLEILVENPDEPVVIDSIRLAAINNENVPEPETFLSGAAVTNGSPNIISRESWGANPAYLDWEPQYSKTRKVVVHHTAGGQGGSNPAAVIRGIYYYHAVTRGWGDIGYNYLVDEHGNIYEGRYGGQRVTGAHALGFNTGSVGISVLGNYNDLGVTGSTIESIKQLSGYVAARHGIDPTDSEWFVDGNYSNILGHRDVGSTSCPGTNLYSQIPGIRSGAGTHLVNYRTNRIPNNGLDRFDTSIEISQDRYPAAATAESVILANAYNYADGLASSSLTSLYDAPLLLTDDDILTSKTRTEIQRVLGGSGTVRIIGGTGVVSSAVENELTGLGYTVERIAGLATRYQTAKAIADRLPASDSVFIVTGDDFPDGISASSPSAKENIPILYSLQDSLPGPTVQFISDNAASLEKAYIVGGTVWFQTMCVYSLKGLGSLFSALGQSIGTTPPVR